MQRIKKLPLAKFLIRSPYEISLGYEFSHPTNLASLVVDFFLSLPNLSLCNSDYLLIFW